MAENRTEQPNGAQSAQNYRLDAMPRLLRLVQYDEHPSPEGMTTCTAKLFHRHITLRVTWTCRQPDPRLHVGGLVSIRWSGKAMTYAGEDLVISRLLPAEKADEQTNLFDTVPPNWVADRNLVERGRALIHQLPRRFRHLFNAIFWNDHRFLRYVTVPAALQGAHTEINGNLRHSIELVESALRMSEGDRLVFRPLIILGGLLYDAGKAEEYKFDVQSGRFKLSERGLLVGHRITALEWISMAKMQYRLEIPEPHALALVHLLTAVKGAPEGMGLREPQSVEASLIAIASRWLLTENASASEQEIEPGCEDADTLQIDNGMQTWWL